MSPRKYPIAYLALFIALGGTSYAELRVPAGSVGTRQLRSGAVTDAKVRKHSLTAHALAPGVVPTAPSLHTQTVARADRISLPGTGLSEAVCPAGSDVVGGGYDVGGTNAVVTASYPVTSAQPQGWDVRRTIPANQQNFVPAFVVYAVCASVG
jgi:hypothetical protein